MPSEIELLPCPHCGGGDIKSVYIHDGRLIGCRDCGASTHAYQPDAEQKARQKWNRRALPSPDVEGQPVYRDLAGRPEVPSITTNSTRSGRTR